MPAIFVSMAMEETVMNPTSIMQSAEEWMRLLRKLQLICGRLENPTVRDDLRNGQIVIAKDIDKMVSALDQLHSILCSSWNGSFLRMTEVLDLAIFHLSLLACGSNKVFSCKDFKETSYSELSSFVYDLVNSKYWLQKVYIACPKNKAKAQRSKSVEKEIYIGKFDGRPVNSNNWTWEHKIPRSSPKAGRRNRRQRVAAMVLDTTTSESISNVDETSFSMSEITDVSLDDTYDCCIPPAKASDNTNFINEVSNPMICTVGYDQIVKNSGLNTVTCKSRDELVNFSHQRISHSNPMNTAWGKNVLAVNLCSQSRGINHDSSSRHNDYNARHCSFLNKSKCMNEGVGKSFRCNWCGTWGHLEITCWHKSGACFACGSLKHRLVNCHLNGHRNNKQVTYGNKAVISPKFIRRGSVHPPEENCETVCSNPDSSESTILKKCVGLFHLDEISLNADERDLEKNIDHALPKVMTQPSTQYRITNNFVDGKCKPKCSAR